MDNNLEKQAKKLNKYYLFKSLIPTKPNDCDGIQPCLRTTNKWCDLASICVCSAGHLPVALNCILPGFIVSERSHIKVKLCWNLVRWVADHHCTSHCFFLIWNKSRALTAQWPALWPNHLITGLCPLPSWHCLFGYLLKCSTNRIFNPIQRFILWRKCHFFWAYIFKEYQWPKIIHIWDTCAVHCCNMSDIVQKKPMLAWQQACNLRGRTRALWTTWTASLRQAAVWRQVNKASTKVDQ